MKKFIFGLLIGIAITTTITAAESKLGFISRSEFTAGGDMSTDDYSLFRLGYVAGASDMLLNSSIISAQPDLTKEETNQLLQKVYGCLNIRGKSVGMLSEFANISWANHASEPDHVNAAWYLILDACKP